MVSRLQDVVLFAMGVVHWRTLPDGGEVAEVADYHVGTVLGSQTAG